MTYIFETGTNDCMINSVLLFIADTCEYHDKSFTTQEIEKIIMPAYCRFSCDKENPSGEQLEEIKRLHDGNLEDMGIEVPKTYTDPILTSISLMTVNGTRLELPTERLDNYKQVKDVLQKAGGKYVKNGFEFKKDPQPIVDRILGGETVNDKKKYQFYETPPELVVRIHELAEMRVDDDVLEPSAGNGALIDALNYCGSIDCVEINSDNRDILYGKGYELCGDELCGDDFLKLDPAVHLKRYDKILANPPFTKNQDIKHIKHMYEFLKPGGRLVSLSSNSWRHGDQKLQVEFRDWLSEQDHVLHSVSAGAFKTSGTNIATTIIVINK